MKESFYFSNMSPQTPSFNRGIWKKLEEMVRSWAHEYNSIYVATGPIFEGEMKTIGPNQVAVPHYYYKVILRKGENGYHSIGFILPNEASSLPLGEFAVSVDSVEKRTHINFFDGLDNAVEEKTEQERCLPCWSWKISNPIPSRKQVHIDVQEKEEEKIPSSVLTNRDESVQCHGVTQKGNRCKKMTKDPSGYCNIHQKIH
jgi:endonuclease G